MSHNITNWKTEELVDFKTPLDPFLADSALTIGLLPENKVKIYGMAEGCEIVGQLTDIQGEKFLNITEISFSGEGSGVYWEHFLTLFRGAKGKMVSVQSWLGGETVVETTITDGVVTENYLT